MAEFTLNGRTKVKTLKANFKENFGSTLRVYTAVDCKTPADDEATLASIRAKGFAGGDLAVKGNMKVSTFEKKVAELYGIGVQVANADNTKFADDSVTLVGAASANSAPKVTESKKDTPKSLKKESVEKQSTKPEQKSEQKPTRASKSSSKEGTLPGVFTVNSNGDKICFSQGILQFNPAKYEFRFAKNQYDVLLKDNEKIAAAYNGWIDLFGWGTSGYMGCQPTEFSEKASEYGPSSGSIIGTNYDWGVYNPITNGGNKEGTWRTPTANEWEYLQTLRPNANKLKAMCQVCGVNGYMLMPDNFWNNRICVPVDTTSETCSTNTYTVEQWAQLESLGVVFIPVAGRREGRQLKDSSDWRVWLAAESRYGYFGGTSTRDKSHGLQVRLIKDIK